MKSKLLLIAVFLGFFSMMMPHAFGAVADSPMLSVVLQSYEPFPAMPGSYVTMRFRATNVGSKTAPDVAFELDPEYPFSLDPNEQNRKSFGSLLPGQSVVFEYKVRVDENAIIGTNNLKLKTATDGTNWIIEDLDVLVKLTESVMSISSVSTEPSAMKPGQISVLNVDVSNLGATAIRDISVKLNLDAALEASAVSSAGLPFSPVESTSEKKLRLLPGGSTETLSFRIMTFPDADSRIYRVPISVSYIDEAGNMDTKNDVIGLLVGSEPKVSASISGVDLNPAKSEVSLRFVNRGTIDLKFFNVKLLGSSDFNLLSPSDEYYIGRLSSDDFDVANFVISFSSDVDKVKLPLVMEYMDANNNEYREEISLELDIDSLGKLDAKNGGGSSTTVIVLLLLAVVGYYVYRKKRRKKRN
ncbi:MAG: COG1361 S-layer family protein [Nanoarchaeota archaeon]